ncbi:hypothetical protein VPHK460_0079 [Vibrio phage K460]
MWSHIRHRRERRFAREVVNNKILTVFLFLEC